jgi:hypothetical protein
MASGGIDLDERRPELTVNSLFGPDDANVDSDTDGSEDMEVLEQNIKVLAVRCCFKG